MKKSNSLSIILIISLIILWSSDSLALQEATHDGINQYIGQQTISGFSLSNYLNNTLGFSAGSNEELPGFDVNGIQTKKRVFEWLGYGGEQEDRPGAWYDYAFGRPTRSVNHFHNPLKTWDQAGLNDTVLGITYTGQSQVLWAQNPGQNPGGHWSWEDARGYFYSALTATSKADRERYFADTFRAVGQLMHLVEDASVPEHVRNDVHILPAYEAAVEGFRTKPQKYNYIWDGWVSSPITFDKSIIDITSTHPSAPVPISRIIDTDLYNGDNPNVTTTVFGSPQYIGIAEYTNANFMSNDTLFTHLEFNYPNISDTVLWTDNDDREYIRKVGSGDTINHLARTSLLYSYRQIYFPQYTEYLPVGLDEECYKDYAQELIPRAVGYSAGLLNYFFRGKMKAVHEEGIYDGSNNITGITMKIRNNTPGESMAPLPAPNESMFIVSYRYNLPGNSNFIYGTSSQVVLTEEIFSGAESTNYFTFNNNPPIPANAENVTFWLVYKGKLGNEENAVVGKVIEPVSLITIPADHVTREMFANEYYNYSPITKKLSSVTDTDLPFDLVDDGGYWDAASSSWTSISHAESLGVPLSVGGPQYIAKYWDAANNRVRFVLNVSYEKNAYQDFHKIYTESGTGFTMKDFYYVIFEGTPLLSLGKYEENPGYMEYMEDPNNPGTYGVYSLRPLAASDPMQRYFSWYNGKNFVDTFLEYDSARFHRFDMTIDVQNVPVDADAPFSSVVAVSRSGNGFNVETPKIFNYTRPTPYWSGSSGYGSSGVDNYTAQIGSSMNYSSSDNKCITEDDNCGNIYTSGEASSAKTIFNIPYNFNSYVRVHRNDGGQYYEELYINGQQEATSSISTTKLETHYQILAAYKDIAVVRETNWISKVENPLAYMYTQILADNGDIIYPRIYEIVHNFTAKYSVYINGNHFDLSNWTRQTTSVQSKILDIPHTADINDGVTGLPIGYYLTFEYVEDITGYHPDRIFISDTFDGQYILVAFDEYDYNNGAGLVHDLKYEESDIGNGKYFLFYDIPPSEIQGVSHEALPVGRKLLLFKSDGTLAGNLQDPVGLNYSIGSIGILN